MIPTKYNVIFFSGNEMNIYSFSLREAIIIASARAINNGNDSRIKYVEDDNGGVFESIKIEISFT